VVPNLARGLAPTVLDQLWVAAITYVRLREEFAFLALEGESNALMNPSDNLAARSSQGASQLMLRFRKPR
jgi:putative transposase